MKGKALIRIAVVALLTAGLFVFTACGSSKEQNGESNATNNADAPTELATAASPTNTPRPTPTTQPSPWPTPLPQENIDPFAFFVGRVVQHFDAETQTVEKIDLLQYINRPNKTIASHTGELFWDYENGVVTYDTDTFQGALGFFEDSPVILSNVTIETANEYVTVACVSLDGKPLSESTKILIQAMTECHYSGYTTDGNKIVAVGEPPSVVVDIAITLTFKDVAARHIAKLDANGYIYQQSTAPSGETFTVTLDRDALYTLLTTETAQGHTVAYQEKAGTDGTWAFTPDKDIFAESPIDLRYLNETVAGENGFIQRDGDHFLRGDGTPLRFWAVNVGPEIINKPREEVDYLARRLSKLGVNMVRMHGSLYNRNPTQLEVIPEATLDQYHYFIYAMKQAGIYVELSFYYPLWVSMRDRFGFEGYVDEFNGVNPFALLIFNEQFQAIYKDWARDILLTVNPYTGVPLVDEPAVAIIEVQNEDNLLFGTFNRAHIPEAQMNILEGFYTEHLLARYGSMEAVYAAWNGYRLDIDTDQRIGLMDIANLTTSGSGEGGKKARASDQLRFLVAYQKQFYDMMVDFYKNTIGTKALITASNWTTADPRVMEALERYTYTAGDIIDRHGYFEEGHKGETSAWRVMRNHTYTDISALLNPMKAIMQSNAVKDYPFTITETAWPMPNRFKGESVPMWTLYGSLQGVDGIFMFAVGNTDWETNTSMKWPLFVPSVAGQFPAFGLMYRQGLITEADIIVDVGYNLEELYLFNKMQMYENYALDNMNRYLN